MSVLLCAIIIIIIIIIYYYYYYYYYYLFLLFTKSTPCGIHTQSKDGGHYVWHKAQTAIAGVLMSWNRSDMHLAASDVRRCSFESLLQSSAHEWRWPT